MQPHIVEALTRAWLTLLTCPRSAMAKVRDYIDYLLDQANMTGASHNTAMRQAMQLD